MGEINETLTDITQPPDIYLLFPGRKSQPLQLTVNKKNHQVEALKSQLFIPAQNERLNEPF